MCTFTFNILFPFTFISTLYLFSLIWWKTITCTLPHSLPLFLSVYLSLYPFFSHFQFIADGGKKCWIDFGQSIDLWMRQFHSMYFKQNMCVFVPIVCCVHILCVSVWIRYKTIRTDTRPLGKTIVAQSAHAYRRFRTGMKKGEWNKKSAHASQTFPHCITTRSNFAITHISKFQLFYLTQPVTRRMIWTVKYPYWDTFNIFESSDSLKISIAIEIDNPRWNILRKKNWKKPPPRMWHIVIYIWHGSKTVFRIQTIWKDVEISIFDDFKLLPDANTFA